MPRNLGLAGGHKSHEREPQLDMYQRTYGKHSRALFVCALGWQRVTGPEVTLVLRAGCREGARGRSPVIWRLAAQDAQIAELGECKLRFSGTAE